MAEQKNYHVTGNCNGKNVDETVTAYSPKQAKLRAAFKMGLGGKCVGKFTRSRTVNVQEIN